VRSLREFTIKDAKMVQVDVIADLAATGGRSSGPQ
jgi:hypothetical protein